MSKEKLTTKNYTNLSNEFVEGKKNLFLKYLYNSPIK